MKCMNAPNLNNFHLHPQMRSRSPINRLKFLAMAAPWCIKFNEDMWDFLDEAVKVPSIQDGHIVIPYNVSIPSSHCPYIFNVIFSIYGLGDSQEEFISFFRGKFLLEP
jgi:hypothetical protein